MSGLLVLADCADRSTPQRAGSGIVLMLILGAWLLVAWLAVWWRAEPEERGWLLALLFACAIVGGAIFLFPNGVSGNGDYLARFFAALLATAAVGFAVGAVSRAFEPLRGLFAGVVGAVAVPGALILFLFWAVLVNGACLD